MIVLKELGRGRDLFFNVKKKPHFIFSIRHAFGRAFRATGVAFRENKTPLFDADND